MTNATVKNYSWRAIRDFEELKNLKPESLGPKHTPVPHYEAITFFKMKLAEHNITVTRDVAILSPDTLRLIYVADVKMSSEDDGKDYSFAVGFINHNDKTKSFTGIAGTHVYANDSSSYVSERAFKTKHMQNVMHYLSERSSNIISWFKEFCEQESGRIERLKSIEATDATLGEVVLAYIREPYILSSTNIKRIVAEFDKIETPEPRKSLWTLQTAANAVFQRVKSPLARLEAMDLLRETLSKALKADQTPADPTLGEAQAQIAAE